jgi:hypothetical protein
VSRLRSQCPACEAVATTASSEGGSGGGSSGSGGNGGSCGGGDSSNSPVCCERPSRVVRVWEPGSRVTLYPAEKPPAGAAGGGDAAVATPSTPGISYSSGRQAARVVECVDSDRMSGVENPSALASILPSSLFYKVDVGGAVLTVPHSRLSHVKSAKYPDCQCKSCVDNARE